MSRKISKTQIRAIEIYNQIKKNYRITKSKYEYRVEKWNCLLGWHNANFGLIDDLIYFKDYKDAEYSLDKNIDSEASFILYKEIKKARKNWE